MRGITIAFILLGVASVQGLVHRNEGSLRGRNDDTPQPIWHTLFNIEFNETSIILFKRQTTGRRGLGPGVWVLMPSTDSLLLTERSAGQQE